MFLPLLRIAGVFFLTIGFLAAVSGTYLVIGQGPIGRIIYLFVLGLVLVGLGAWLRQKGGEGDLVGVEPGEIAHDFRIAVAYGLGAHASPAATALAGAAASVAIVLFVAFLGFVSPTALIAAVALFGLFGAVLALVKRRCLKKGSFVMRKGKRYGAHRTLSVYAVPAIVVAWLIASAPEADGAIILLTAGILIFWIGSVYHHLWEVFHIAALVLFYGADSQKAIEWGLMEWIRYVRLTDRVASVSYDVETSRVAVEGEIADFEDFARELGRLDFVSEVVTR